MTTTVGSGQYTYILEEHWARLPEGMTMGNASAVATDSQNRVYVFQRKDPPVLIFGPGGNYLGSWGLRAIDEAHGIYIQDDVVYLTDRTDSVCLIYTLDGKPLQVIGQRGVHSDTGCEIPGEVCPVPPAPSTTLRSWRRRPTATCMWPMATATRGCIAFPPTVG